MGLNVFVSIDDRVAHGGALRREPLADPRLAASAAVRVGGVERRDPEIPGRVHDPRRLLARDALPEERRRRADAAEVAAAEDDPRDRDAAPPELAPLHHAILSRVSAPRTTRRRSDACEEERADERPDRADDEHAVVADTDRDRAEAERADREPELGERRERPDDGAALARRRR